MDQTVSSVADAENRFMQSKKEMIQNAAYRRIPVCRIFAESVEKGNRDLAGNSEKVIKGVLQCVCICAIL